MTNIGPSTARRVLVIGEPDSTLSPEDVLAPDGMLIMLEDSADRAADARRRFALSGIDRRATVISGEPRRMLYKLAGPFDVIFCDDEDPALQKRLATLLAPNGVLIGNDHSQQHP